MLALLLEETRWEEKEGCLSITLASCIPAQNFGDAATSIPTPNKQSARNITMASNYSDSGESDEDIMEAQVGARKRRRLSPTSNGSANSDTEPMPRIPTATISRIKSKQQQPSQPPTNRQPVPAATAAVASNGENLSFASINVAPWLVASLSSMEIKKPTGIQKACIPEILKGRDCIGGSRTGTGKTVAFSVPILQKWAEDPCGIFGLIIT